MSYPKIEKYFVIDILLLLICISLSSCATMIDKSINHAIGNECNYPGCHNVPRDGSRYCKSHDYKYLEKLEKQRVKESIKKAKQTYKSQRVEH